MDPKKIKKAVMAAYITTYGEDADPRIERYVAASEALENALTVLAKAMPHGRDYPHGAQSEDYVRDRAVFQQIGEAVHAAQQCMMNSAVALHNAADGDVWGGNHAVAPSTGEVADIQEGGAA